MRTPPPSTPAIPSDHAAAQAGRLTLAYLIDSAAVLATASLLYLLRPSILLALLTAIELCLVMVFTRAITGHTLGSLITRTRAIRLHTNTAPGLAAECLHALILGLLQLTIVGPLLVHALARGGQSLPDRLAGIITIQPSATSSQETQAISQDAYGRQTLAHASPTSWAPTPPPQAERIETLTAPAAHSAPVLPAPAMPPVHTPVPSMPVKDETPRQSQPTPKPEHSQNQQYWVVFDSGEHSPITTTLLIGRSPTARSAGETVLSIPDPTRSLSRTHVRIVRSRTGLWVDDLGSANGTQIHHPDGTTVEVTPGSPEKVTAGCTILLGERSFQVTSQTP